MVPLFHLVSPIARFYIRWVDRLSFNWLVDATCGYVTGVHVVCHKLG